MIRKENNRPRRERWDRENAASRLKQEVPYLKSLRVDLVEKRAGRDIPGTRRTQHVIVDTASARFEVPCMDSGCNGGGHELSRLALSHLRERRAAFSGSSECSGYVNDRPCDRQLEYAFLAEYLAPTPVK